MALDSKTLKNLIRDKRDAEVRMRLKLSADLVLALSREAIAKSPSEIQTVVASFDASGVPLIEMFLATMFQTLTSDYDGAEKLAHEFLMRAADGLNPDLKRQVREEVEKFHAQCRDSEGDDGSANRS